MEKLKDRYGKLKTLMNNLGPFVGGEQDKVHEILELFDRVTKETGKRRIWRDACKP
ncbi:MAG: hypothetical protein IPH15_06655 [Comamonadaceae bacterium]|nr:hypothetical protein [Comamonadaceae bacterium]